MKDTCARCGQSVSWERMTFGQRVKHLREADGLTQKVLAEQMKIPQTSLFAYETRGEWPAEGIVKMLAEGLGVSWHVLIGLEAPGTLSARQKLENIREIALDTEHTAKTRLSLIIDEYHRPEAPVLAELADPLTERVNALEASLKAAGIPLCERVV